jgi:hypothetical protein
VPPRPRAGKPVTCRNPHAVGTAGYMNPRPLDPRTLRLARPLVRTGLTDVDAVRPHAHRSAVRMPCSPDLVHNDRPAWLYCSSSAPLGNPSLRTWPWPSMCMAVVIQFVTQRPSVRRRSRSTDSTLRASSVLSPSGKPEWFTWVHEPTDTQPDRGYCRRAGRACSIRRVGDPDVVPPRPTQVVVLGHHAARPLRAPRSYGTRHCPWTSRTQTRDRRRGRVPASRRSMTLSRRRGALTSAVGRNQ